MSQKKRILVVDDEPNIREVVELYLRREGFEVEVTADGAAALTAIERKYLLFLVDLSLVNGSLLAAVTLWNDFSPSLPVVLAHFKWFITLSVLWWIIGAVLDIYNLARSASPHLNFELFD